MLQSVARFKPTPGRLVLPDVCCDVTLVDGRAFFTGPMTHARPSAHTGQEVVLLRMRVATAHALLQVPLAELTDLVVPLADINRSLARTIEARFESGTSAGLLDDGPVGPSDRRFAAAAQALAEGGSVVAVAEHISLSSRQLERMFSERVGVAPKLFARIVRFRRAIIDVCKGKPLALAAATHGYADQSHFTREAHALTSLSPRALLANLAHVASVQDITSWRNVGCE